MPGRDALFRSSPCCLAPKSLAFMRDSFLHARHLHPVWRLKQQTSGSKSLYPSGSKLSLAQCPHHSCLGTLMSLLDESRSFANFCSLLGGPFVQILHDEKRNGTFTVLTS